MWKKNFIVTLKKKILATSRKLFLTPAFFPNLTSFASTFANTSGLSHHLSILLLPSTYLWLALQQRLLSFEMCKYANWFPNFFGVFLHNLIWNILPHLIIRSHYYYFSIINFIGKNNYPEASNYISYPFFILSIIFIIILDQYWEQMIGPLGPHVLFPWCIRNIFVKCQ